MGPKIQPNIKIFHMNLDFQDRFNKTFSALMHAVVKGNVHWGVAHVTDNALMMTAQLMFRFSKKVINTLAHIVKRSKLMLIASCLIDFFLI